MKKPTPNQLMMPHEIVHVLPRPETPDQDDADDRSFYAYILDSVKRNGKVIGYTCLPVADIPKGDAAKQIEIDLLREYRGRISEKLPTVAATVKDFRVIFQIEEISALGDYKLTPVARVQDIAFQKKIEEASIKNFVRSHFAIVNGEPHFVSSPAATRNMPNTKEKPYYLDIDVHHAAAAGYIPKAVADILKKHGKISRLGTANDIAMDSNKDKLLQIYDHSRPLQTMSFDVFANYIKAGMAYFTNEVMKNTAAVEAKLPVDAKVRYPGKEKVKFEFVERCLDLSIDDAHKEHYFANEETHKVLKAAGFKTLRAAFNTIEEHGVSSIRTAFKKAGATEITLHDIAQDVRGAQEAFDAYVENPDDYTPFDWNVQTHYPAQEVK